ncbi:MAG TPA: alpha-galactosidase, partial [Jatrophihabitans sp.]|nr:alpha-galactosidase [Jatrophihabitans sp.]
TLRTELDPVPGGPLRIRHSLTNTAPEPYVVDHLDVVVPVPDRVGELLDCTGRWGRERTPQRHAITDGTWLRESRGGRPGHASATELVAGTAGFGFAAGDVWAVHVAWSGNGRYFLQRQPSGLVTLGGGELLLPGEIVLEPGESYSTPWVYFAASGGGLDGLAGQLHDYLRSLPAHPKQPRPVVSNVWEAVYFDHDLDRLTRLADLAARVGVERVVLDDGWFGARRNDHAGLGDWTVSEQAWPHGLSPFVDHVRGLGMDFGLWFEPEMVNPDSDLFRAHPDWILAVSGREPAQHRNQLVLDLGRPEVRDHLYQQLDAILSAYPIGYVKWDHNRDLVEAASRARHDAPGAHRQTLGYYTLLDRLRAAHPTVEWESCAAGGARIDLEVLQRVQRVWTSDMTDALARQGIQRWTAQLVAPEYLGAHVSAPVNHQTGRGASLDFRAATAFFGSFGIEWDLAAAGEDDLERLAEWITLYKQHRDLLHAGRMIRVDSAPDAVWVHGVVSMDGSAALIAYVQLDELLHDPPPLRVPGLDPRRRYTARSVAPGGAAAPWRGEGMTLTGAALAAVGLPAPARWPVTALIVALTAE